MEKQKEIRFRVSERLHLKIKKQAAKDKRSMAGQVLHYIERGMKDAD